MNATSETPKGGLDLVKWLGVLVLLTLMVAANYIYEFSAVEKAASIVVLVGLAAFIAAKTSKGAAFIEFAKEARTEVRKVVWPTRQETMQTTIIVMVATLIVALALWGLDSILLSLVSFTTGLRI
ncbi:preprotein translocase subunit SecE [Rheinheimera mangrovi]|jgi:preprotein translocase subunit SecE|uniref:preprotein translocase subunit SecE n=1 Tax=Rheinheimera mangrovi TaxID=2498451 RepID=UPI000F8D61D5|nr:preprotein translocase subunit SecE [Rheinheimera mangrovi]